MHILSDKRFFRLLALGASLATGCASVARPGLSEPSDIPLEGKATLADERPKAVVRAANPQLAQGLTVEAAVELAVEQHPKLAQVTWAIEAAKGRAMQAGMYPNPGLAINGNELGDRTGPGGIWSVSASQEVVTAGKLELSQAAAEKEIDQATIALVAERLLVTAQVRKAFYEAIAIQRQIEILKELVAVAEKTVQNAENLLKAKEAARLDVVQLEVDLERYRTELEASQKALPAAQRRLAAAIGVGDLPADTLVGYLDATAPRYDLDQLRAYVAKTHPEVRLAQLGVDRAQLLARRAEVEPIPNVTVQSGYTYQGQNRSHDWDLGVSLPIPLWNRNRGNIIAAKAQVGEATNQVKIVQNELLTRLATAYGAYAAALKKAERYEQSILPKAKETYQLAEKAFQGGQFEYLRVLAAQRVVVEANLEIVKSRGEMWRAASEIAGLLIDQQLTKPNE